MFTGHAISGAELLTPLGLDTVITKQPNNQITNTNMSYLGMALLLLIRDHKGEGEGGNCDGSRPYSIARPYIRL